METCKYVELNEAEKEALKQFKINLSDVLTPEMTDVVLLKWLRAKNFNLRKSEYLFREDINCKLTFRISNVENWNVPEVMKKYDFSNSNIGISKDGTPVHYLALGRGDLRGFVSSAETYDIIKFSTFVIEQDLRKCKEQSKKLGRDINEVNYIVDMEHFSLRQLFSAGIIELGLDLFRLLQDHYPEIWKNILIVNAPIYYYTAFNIFKPIFRSTFLKNFYVAGRDTTAELLLKYVDEDVLPAFLGGKRVDSNGDPMCSEFIKFGGLIPEEYYLRHRCPLLPTDKGVEDIWLSPRSCYNHSLIIKEANSTIRVEIRTEGGSILCCILYRKFGPDPDNPDLPSNDEYLEEHDPKCNVELVSPNIHLQTHISPVDNDVTAVRPGIYIFKFDNTYSWLTSRRIIFRFHVLPPDI